MAEQEPYEEGEIAEVERDLDRLETPDETATEQIDADEDEIREVERETDAFVVVLEDHTADEDGLAVPPGAVTGQDADTDGALDVAQVYAPEDEIQSLEEEL